MKEVTLPAAVANLGEVTAFVDGALQKAHCSTKTQMVIEVAVEEIFTNIAQYAYQAEHDTNELGNVTIRVSIDDQNITLTFIDSGIPYNPLDKEDPDVTASAAEREIGGLGIFMVKQTMDEVAYEYQGGKNILTLKKQNV